MTIKNATPEPGRTIHLELSDGSSKTIDVSHLLVGPVFENIRSNQEALTSST